MIRKFNYMTPGRDDNAEAKLYTRKDLEARKKAGEVTEAEAADELSAQITQGLGGKDNISDVDCCITRLRCTVKDPAKVDQQLLKSTGASGVLCKGQGVQVVYGPRVSVIKSNLELPEIPPLTNHPLRWQSPRRKRNPFETKPADAPKAGGERLTVLCKPFWPVRSSRWKRLPTAYTVKRWWATASPWNPRRMKFWPRRTARSLWCSTPSTPSPCAPPRAWICWFTWASTPSA